MWSHKNVELDGARNGVFESHQHIDVIKAMRLDEVIEGEKGRDV